MPPTYAALGTYDEGAQLILLGNGHSNLSSGCAVCRIVFDDVASAARGGGQLHAKRRVAGVSTSWGMGAGVGARVGDTVGFGVGLGVGGGMGAFVNRWFSVHRHSG